MMRLCSLFPLLATGTLTAQITIDGRLHGVDHQKPELRIPLSSVIAIANVPGPDAEPLSFRTWETEPAGWFHLSGTEGRYTLAFTNPAHFMRPRILTNQFTKNGDRIDLRLFGDFDYACFHDKSWDPKPTHRYLQPFVARGSSITAVGFKLATDGVDGGGPGKQDVTISIHRRTSAPPEQWPQVGPSATVLDVDCGGPKSYWFSAGWRSGEVPTEPGQKYAVSVRPSRPGAQFQTFWRKRAGGDAGLFRASPEGNGFVPFDMWLAVTSDRDGLLIPYNKRVHRKFTSLTNLERKWSQTWVAKGRGLASVVLYAAVSGKQPPLSRQRVAVRVREGGPSGPLVGTEKIAVGNGNYTGDASWGHFVAVFAPGEISLQPGTLYALEFASIETTHTIGDFVNIKKEVSDGRAGFNPYRKCPPDEYPHGTAFRHGTEAQDFDLDLQVVEYAHHSSLWEHALAGPELLANGAMQQSDPDGDQLLSWKAFRIGESAELSRFVDLKDAKNAVARISAANTTQAVDGGWVQRVTGLKRNDTCRLSGRVRSTWPVSTERKSMIGIDPTGQTEDPDAATIRWTLTPKRHGEFIRHVSEPVRPADGSVSIWLRASCKKEDVRFPFRTEFDDFSLKRVDVGVPTTTREGE